MFNDFNFDSFKEDIMKQIESAKSMANDINVKKQELNEIEEKIALLSMSLVKFEKEKQNKIKEIEQLQCELNESNVSMFMSTKVEPKESKEETPVTTVCTKVSEAKNKPSFFDDAEDNDSAGMY